MTRHPAPPPARPVEGASSGSVHTGSRDPAARNEGDSSYRTRGIAQAHRHDRLSFLLLLRLPTSAASAPRPAPHEKCAIRGPGIETWQAASAAIHSAP